MKFIQGHNRNQAQLFPVSLYQSILKTSSTIKRQILTPVRREKFSEQTERGTRNSVSGITSSYLSNTRHDHVIAVRHTHNAQDQKKGRILSRTTFAEYYETNRKNYQEKEHLYKRRQIIVEPF